MPKIYRITDYDIAPERIVATDVLYIEMQSQRVVTCSNGAFYSLVVEESKFECISKFVIVK